MFARPDEEGACFTAQPDGLAGTPDDRTFANRFNRGELMACRTVSLLDTDA
jgi:hypothetical protein